MAGQRSEFGYYPGPLDITVGPVSIATLAGLPETVADIEADPGCERKWIYAPLQPVAHLGGDCAWGGGISSTGGGRWGCLGRVIVAPRTP